MSPIRSASKRRTVRKHKKLPFHHRWWRHGKWVSGFCALFALGFLSALVQFGTAPVPQAVAGMNENAKGFLWSEHAGWISLNDLNPCGQANCGNYGVNVDPNTRNMVGFAWSDQAGWICFGASCAAHVDCNGTTPDNKVPYANLNMGQGVVKLNGWAKVCNQADKGWISLNCQNTGTCGTHDYSAKYNTATKYFQSANPPLITGAVDSMGWNGNSDNTGYGYIDFQKAFLALTESCTNGMDDDMNGLADCADPACQATPTCQETATNGNCLNNLDDNGNGVKDCGEAACKTTPACAEQTGNNDGSGTPLCSDGIDDDGDGLVDCVDDGCGLYPGCTIVGEPAATPADPHAACSDKVDNDLNGVEDCKDINCQKADAVCTPAWLEAKFGNIYAQQGIEGNPIANSKGTYCLTSNGTISNFSSAAGCTEQGQTSLSLPKGSTGYQGTLGSLDITGILSGRYGKVVELGVGELTTQVNFSDILGGKVYHVSGNAILNTRTFRNGGNSTERGNGLLVVEGNLTIIGNLSYEPIVNITSLRQMSSFGVIAKKNTAFQVPDKNGVLGPGGNIYIQPSVNKVVGAYFAEDTIYTGTNGGVDNTPLDVFGLLAAWKIKLERNYQGHPATAAETVTFDARAVSNPPPGMSDISKSLPTARDTF